MEDRMIGWVGQCAVVAAPAEVDVSSAGEFRDAMLRAIGEGAAALVADLSRTTFCDSTGIKALADAHRWASDVHCDMRAVVRAVAVRRIFTITSLHRLMPICEHLDEALAGLPAASAQREETPGAATGESAGD